jgi:hypothetical protein
MNTRTQTSKLAELRTRTDRQLYALVVRRLEEATTAGEWDAIRRLLPFLSRTDRRRIEERMEELRAGACLRAACY